MGIPSMSALSVVIDPASRETSLSVRLADVVRENWNRWREQRRMRAALAAVSEQDLREIGLGYDEIGLVRSGFNVAPRAWTGDIARPGK